jgi:conjugal transfer/entry exclusion protein
MCVTSAIIDQWTNPFTPAFVPWPQVSPNLAQEMLTVVQKLEAIDKRLGQLECKLEAATKERFKARLKKRASAKKWKRPADEPSKDRE